MPGCEDADKIAVPDAFGDLFLVALGWSLEFLDRHLFQHVPQDEGRGDRFFESQLCHGTPLAFAPGPLMSGVPLGCIRSDAWMKLPGDACLECEESSLCEELWAVCENPSFFGRNRQWVGDFSGELLACAVPISAEPIGGTTLGSLRS